MDHDLGAREGQALAGRAAAQDHGGRRHSHAHAHRGHVGADVLDDVVDGHAGIGKPTRGVDVERDVTLGVLRLEVEQLGDDEVGDLVVDLLPEEHDALAQEQRVDVEGALAARRLLKHGGDHRLS